MTALGVIVLVTVALIGIVYGARLYLHHRMAQSFGLGLKIGAVVGTKGKAWTDEQLRSAGIDPDTLP